MIVGATEDNHYLKSLPGVPKEEVEEVKKKANDWTRNGIEPPGISIACKDIPLGKDRFVVIVRIEQSWIGPHKVADTGRYMTRHAAGNRDMTVDELRQSFGQIASAIDRMRGFQAHRAESVRTASIPYRMPSGPKALLHLFSLSGILRQFRIDIHKAHEKLLELGTRQFMFGSRRYNLDGAAGTDQVGESQDGYVQVFRDGTLEFVWSLPVERDYIADESEATFVMPPEYFVVPQLLRALSFMNALEYPDPVYALISVADVQGCRIKAPRGVYVRHSYQVWHQNLLLPDVELPADPEASVQAVKQVFDVFWQAFGFQGSPLFDADGAFRPR
jgi:hypothetical protein